MAQNTALQTLIEDVKENMRGSILTLQESGLNPLERRHYNATIIVAKDVIAKATELLPKERKQIIEAWVDGGKMLSAKNAEQYFTNTFNQ